MQHVFIIGSRGLPAQYGGFETFVDELVKHQKNKTIKYHVACQSENSDLALPGDHFEYRGADCFVIKVPKIGSARVIAYDILAINAALKYCKKEEIKPQDICKLKLSKYIQKRFSIIQEKDRNTNLFHWFENTGGVKGGGSSGGLGNRV